MKWIDNKHSPFSSASICNFQITEDFYQDYIRQKAIARFWYIWRPFLKLTYVTWYEIQSFLTQDFRTQKFLFLCGNKSVLATPPPLLTDEQMRQTLTEWFFLWKDSETFKHENNLIQFSFVILCKKLKYHIKDGYYNSHKECQ